MQIQLAAAAQALLALVAGVTIGASFGLVQESASRRHQKLENTGKFNSGWAAMPGSMRRVAYLLVALALVQLVCPLLFTNGLQWWVSGGVAAGYGLILLRQLRRRVAQNG